MFLASIFRFLRSRSRKYLPLSYSLASSIICSLVAVSKYSATRLLAPVDPPASSALRRAPIICLSVRPLNPGLTITGLPSAPVLYFGFVALTLATTSAVPVSLKSFFFLGVFFCCSFLASISFTAWSTSFCSDSAFRLVALAFDVASTRRASLSLGF